MVDMEFMEYKNLPMKVAFSEKELSEKVAVLFSETPEEFKRLCCSKRTFRQYMHLGGDQELDSEISEKIYSYLEESDKKHPYSMKELYPYLQEDEWELEMNDVSFIKVDVRSKGADYQAVSKVVKTRDLELIFYPYELHYQTRDETEMLQIIKRILLEGTVDLDDVF